MTGHNKQGWNWAKHVRYFLWRWFGYLHTNEEGEFRNVRYGLGWNVTP